MLMSTIAPIGSDDSPSPISTHYNIFDFCTQFAFSWAEHADSCKHPFATSLQELVEHESNVGKDESADVKAKEFACVASAKLETDVCW